MIFKSTFKLLLTNFSLTYKVLIHKLLIFLLALGVAGTIGESFLMYLAESNFFNFAVEQVTFMMQNINLTTIFVCFKDLFLKVVEIFTLMDTAVLINAIISISTFIVIFGFLGGLSELAVIDCINSKLSSKTRISYFKSVISKMFKSLLLSIIKFILIIPYLICVGLMFYYGFIWFEGASEFIALIIPTLLFLGFVIITSIYLSVIVGFAPSVIIHNEGVIKGLFKGFKTITKKYFRVLSTSLMIVFILTVSNLFIAVFSFFAGLILTLPITYVIISLFKVISFYECNGMRYYVGDNIRTPLKKGEQDKIKKMKYIV